VGIAIDPWIDPDERFMLLSCPPDQGAPVRTDIGISIRQGDGTWSKPVRISESVNTQAYERFPSLSPDGKYLFFIRSTSEGFVGDQAHFYWVDAKILDEFMARTQKQQQTALQLLSRPVVCQNSLQR
jgi:hypothetical protein